MLSNNTYYIPDRINTILSGMYNYPAVVVESPSGFGKTTTVREYLKTKTFRESDKYWHTCFGEPVEKSWDAFCLMLSNFDESTSGYLKRLGVPNDSNLADVASAMRRCEGRDETYIVVDNFQYIYKELPTAIIDALASHGNPKLHLIFITQSINFSDRRKALSENILHIKNKDFVFTKDETDEYLKQKDITLSSKALGDIYNFTEGWIAALNLQRIVYENSGRFQQSADMDALIKSVMWDELSETEKEFLLRVSVLDKFTFEQARIMSGEDIIKADIINLLETNAFIRYDHAEKSYVLHALLRSYLRNEFDKLSDVHTKSIWALAGKAYESRNLNYQALLCYLNIKDYHSLFELRITGDEFTSYISVGSTKALIDIINDCPEEILLLYPQKLLVIAFELFMAGGGDTFRRVCQLINMVIEDKDIINLNDDDYRIVAGEFARLESFLAFNDIKKMSDKHQEALELLGGPATLFDWRDSWTFGQPSVLYLFWSKVGDLDYELDLMDECLPYYYKLTYDHGSGAESLMRAEALLLRGEDKKAETLCHKALYMAASKDQDSICYGAELVLARIAMLRGDSDSYNNVLSNMNKRLLTGKEPGGQRIVDLAHAFLETAQGASIDLEWLSDLEQIKQNLYPVASFYGLFIHLNNLLINTEYAAVIGLSEPILEEVKRNNFLLPQVYIYIFMAIAQFRLEEEDEALKAFDKAYSLAIPDKLYMPFAELGIKLEPLLKLRKNKKGVADILDMSKRLSEGLHIIKSQLSDRPVLTQREHEVAVLAGKGLTNTQIASQLFVSVNTIKVLLKRVFAKLGIKSRTQLSDYI